MFSYCKHKLGSATKMVWLVWILFMKYIESYVVPGEELHEDLNEYNQRSCLCVPYWQCKEDYSGLIEDGVDIIDIRVVRETSNQVGTSCTGDFDVCCQIECGKFNNGLLSSKSPFEGFEYKIFGADNDAYFAEFPWMLGLLQDKVFKCGASLIHPQVAITAAHCVSSRGKFRVRAGEWNWANQDEPLAHQDRITKKIIIHPQFDPGSLNNDIALLLLEDSFRLTSNVGIVCIPDEKSTLDKSKCITTGWGKSSFKKGSYQSVLKKLSLPIVPNASCLHSLRKALLGPNFSLHKSFICAGGRHKKDACKGDGGSPLICPIAGQLDRYEQAGIVSWGLTCGQYNTPGVYVNTALFSDWIDKEMAALNFDTFIYRSSK